MIDQELKDRAKEIIAKDMFPSFATIDENGFPQIRAMMTTAVEDCFTQYFVTARQSAKCAHIAANPKVSTFWKDVVSPMTDWCSVLIKGEAEVSDDMDLKKRFWMEEIRTFFPGGVDDPNYVIIVCKPIEMIIADQSMMPASTVNLREKSLSHSG